MCTRNSLNIYFHVNVWRFSLIDGHPPTHLFPSKVNLWAVARPALEPLHARRGASRLRQAPVGFEHALSVDLAELVGIKGGTSKEGGAKHIALHGNLLALATDHAVFLIYLSFGVKGEFVSRWWLFTI